MDELMQNVYINILSTIGKTSVPVETIEAILKRLVSFGYALNEVDSWMICFAIQKTENHIKNSCNTSAIPEGLLNTAVDMICGEFLYTKKQSGKLEIDGLDLTSAIKSISEGDTTVQFADGSSDVDRFDALLNYLLHNGEGDFVCYRRLKW